SLRLVPEHDALGLRDLQVLPERQGLGIGTWAALQAQAITASRDFLRLQLRVYEENPARALYARVGCKTESVSGGTVHMAWAVQQAQAITRSRGFLRLQRGVYEESPAGALYARVGFRAESVSGGTVHVAWAVPPNKSFKPMPLRGTA